jgi:hypothetical protein
MVVRIERIAGFGEAMDIADPIWIDVVWMKIRRKVAERIKDREGFQRPRLHIRMYENDVSGPLW